jgi:hypothetical protein
MNDKQMIERLLKALNDLHYTASTVLMLAAEDQSRAEAWAEELDELDESLDRAKVQLVEGMKVLSED